MATTRTIAACLLLMLSLGSLYAWSVLVVPLESELGVTRTTISGVFSLGTVCFMAGMLAMPFLGRLLSPGSIAVLAAVLAAAGLALAGGGGSLTALMVGYGGLFGLANGIGYNACLQMVHALPLRRHGALTGVVVASYAAGSAGFAPVLALWTGLWGPGTALLLLAAFFALVAALMRPLLRPTGARAGTAVDDGAGGPPPSALFPLLWLCFFLNSVLGVLTLAHAAPMTAWAGGAAPHLALAAALVTIGNGIGRLAGGWLADIIPARALLMLPPAVGAGFLAHAALGPSPAALLATLLVVGICYGCIASALPALVARFYGRGRFAAVYGRLFTGWGAAGLLAPLLGGAFFDEAGSYRGALAAAAAIGIAAAAVGAAIRPVPSRRGA